MAALVGFCDGLRDIVTSGLASTAAAQAAGGLIPALLADDAWLPEAWAQPDTERYQQHLLYLDPLSRFSVVSFVWAPGQRTPIHDHGVWGVVGMLRGAETSTRYAADPRGGTLMRRESRTLHVGEVELLDPALGDIHVVENALDNQVSVSIHAYGGDIGTISRHTFQPDGTAREFVSRYSQVPAALESLSAC